MVGKLSHRLETLATQMKWRLKEGNGTCQYFLGVTDNGHLKGIKFIDLIESLKTLYFISKTVSAHITLITTIKVKKSEDLSLYLATIEIMSNTRNQNVYDFYFIFKNKKFSEIRFAVIGNLSCGKSTLISVLVNGQLDDGYGSARVGRFSHLHEELSGETSSTIIDILGFDQNNTVYYLIKFNNKKLKNYSNCSSMNRIVEISKRIVAFIDLAGNPKYIRTTLIGMTSNLPHYCLLIIDATLNELGKFEYILFLILYR